MHTSHRTQEQQSEDSQSVGSYVENVQAKLAIGAVDDPLEHEADRVADQVMSMPETIPVASSGVSSIQRKCADCEEEKEHIQRKPLASFIQRKETSGGITASEGVSQQIQASKGGGHSMDGSTQSFMQSRFGADFSGVKIHTGGEAIQMNRELNAKAFTVGKDIYFNDGQYQPNSEEGKRLLAHELVHTVQQEGGPTSLQRAVSASRVSCHSYPRTYPIFTWMGTNDPLGEIQNADARAIELLTSTIDQLESVMSRIQGGASPFVPTFSDCMAESIQTRLRINPENVGSWTGNRAGSVGHFIRWLINLRRTFESGWVRYNCRGPLCESNFGAYILPGQGFLVNLCVQFWSDPNNDSRAIQLIHELAHVYYNTEDSGRGAGSSYCLHGVVADLNGLHTAVASLENCGGGTMVSC